MTESVMVMIPLLITFLSVLQISTGVMSRTVSSNVVQGEVAQVAITPQQSSQGSLHSTEIELPGGGTLTIGSQQIHKPAVSPLLPGGDNYEAAGVAITE
jgi:hypothetical protein